MERNIVICKNDKNEATYYMSLRIISYVIAIGFFVLGSAIRIGLFDTVFLKQHSILLYLGILLLLILTFGVANRSFVNCFNKRGFYLSVIGISLSFFILCFNYGLSLMNSFISVIFPVFLIFYIFKDVISFRIFINSFLNIFTICIFLMFFTQIIDVFSNYSFTNWMATFTNESSFFRQALQNRTVTYMGHPLFSSQLYLMYFSLRVLYGKLFKKKISVFLTLLCIIGIALTQSRVGLVCILFMILLNYFNRKQFLTGALIIFFVVLLYYLGIFDGVLERLHTTISNGDITSGRNSAIIELIGNNQLQFYWFKGQSIEYDGTVTRLAIALEYPFFNWAYVYGLVVAIILSFFIVLFPIAKLIKSKTYFELIIMIIMLIDVMSYNGIANNGDKPILFYMYIALILNFSRFKKELVEQSCY